MKASPVILVVDDQPQNIELLEAFLMPDGYEIIRAASGEEALEKLSSIPVDLILLDVMMPGMDGFEVTRKIRADEKCRLLPVVLVTALRETEDRVKGIEAGGTDFISKPVDKTELLARIKSLLKVKAYHDLMGTYREELEAEVTKRTVELRHAFEKIKAASLDTIYRLSVASEYKDGDTGAHIKRMSRYSAAVARRMGLDEGTVETILYAAPMHDLGKLGIPDQILTKPAKLDSVQWEIMKLHTVIGARILKGSDAEFIKLGETIAQHHHEKWDGSGYPKGLKGAEIPVSGRIAAIADVFDALTSKRPYKEAFSVEASLSIIREGSGTHFDPEVVDSFFAVQQEILDIREQHGKDDLQALDIPELKALLQRHSSVDLCEGPAQQAAERDSAISILAVKLVSSVSISEISELVLESAQRLTCSSYGFVGYVDLESGFMISPAMIKGTWESPKSEGEASIFKKSDGLWAWVLNNRQPLLTNTPADDPRFAATAPGGAPLGNFLSAPALIGAELVGQVALANSSREYDQRDLEFVQRLASLYAIAIQHQRTEDRMLKLAYHDPLTGLPNRALFNDRYALAVAAAGRYRRKLGFMVLDLDGFKKVNDTFGHAAGDAILKDFSNRLTNLMRKTDTIMRLGGDEFAIMLTDVVENGAIATVAQKILEAIRKPFRFQDHEVKITASIGISCYPDDGDTVELLLKSADTAMYKVKDAGGDSYARYLPGMKSSAPA